MDLTAIIITHNESSNIAACIRSLPSDWAVIVVDSGSDDDTVRIAIDHGATVISQTWLGYGKQKQFACEQSKTDWVISIDADERLTNQLVSEIRSLDLTDPSVAVAIPRSTYFLGSAIKHCGWAPDYVTRIFHKSFCYFTNDLVHERVVGFKKLNHLKNPLMHFSYQSRVDVTTKTNRYAQLGAQMLSERNGAKDFSFARLRGCFAFFRTYILKLGFLDGIAGFNVSLMNQQVTRRKYKMANQLIGKKNATQIVIVQPKNLGDCLLLCGVASSLQELIQKPVVIYTKKENREVVNLYPNLDYREFSGGALKNQIKLGCSLFKKHRYQPAFLFNFSESSSSLVLGCINKNALSFLAGRYPLSTQMAFSQVSEANYLQIEKVQQFILAFKQAFPDIKEHELRIRRPSYQTSNKSQKPYIVIHTESRWSFKSLPTKAWNRLINSIHKLHPELEIRLTGSIPIDQISTTDYCTDLRGKTTVPQLVNHIAGTSYFIGIDSFASHLANLLGVRGITIFGPTDSHVWGHSNGTAPPFKSKLFSCMPCNQDGCNGSKNSQCLQYGSDEMNALCSRISSDLAEIL